VKIGLSLVFNLVNNFFIIVAFFFYGSDVLTLFIAAHKVMAGTPRRAVIVEVNHVRNTWG
tara:strand:+ start:204 stop:383 length:180 start_codon:yes stop_codon:yes gene_type:complete